MITEEWRDVPGLEGVQASSLGRVRVRYERPFGKRTKVVVIEPTYGRLEMPDKSRPNYFRRMVRIHRKNRKVHKLVALAFIGPAPADKPLVLHWNEDSDDNRAVNLYYGDAKDNANEPGYVAYLKNGHAAKMLAARAAKRCS